MPADVTLFSKPGCHLCETVEQKLLALKARSPFDLEVVNIASSPELTAKYGFDIPAVTVNGALFSTHFLDEEALERHLLKEGAAHASQS